MTNHHNILAAMSRDEKLAEALRHGRVAAFEKLNLTFEELYAPSWNQEDESFDFLCGVSCGSCAITPGICSDFTG
ncbi:MAG TPA: hypothetical protein VJA94_07765 [Candidatus Angelobacter sp.]